MLVQLHDFFFLVLRQALNLSFNLYILVSKTNQISNVRVDIASLGSSSKVYYKISEKFQGNFREIWIQNGGNWK